MQGLDGCYDFVHANEIELERKCRLRKIMHSGNHVSVKRYSNIFSHANFS